MVSDVGDDDPDDEDDESDRTVETFCSVVPCFCICYVTNGYLYIQLLGAVRAFVFCMIENAKKGSTEYTKIYIQLKYTLYTFKYTIMENIDV